MFTRKRSQYKERRDEKFKGSRKKEMLSGGCENKMPIRMRRQKRTRRQRVGKGKRFQETEMMSSENRKDAKRKSCQETEFQDSEPLRERAVKRQGCQEKEMLKERHANRKGCPGKSGARDGGVKKKKVATPGGVAKMKRCHATGSSRETDSSEEKEVSRQRDGVSRERIAKRYFCREKGCLCDALSAEIDSWQKARGHTRKDARGRSCQEKAAKWYRTGCGPKLRRLTAMS